MAIVEPILGWRQQLASGTRFVVGFVVAAAFAGVVGPIVLAIVVGEIWRH